jgi:hypothetical protein
MAETNDGQTYDKLINGKPYSVINGALVAGYRPGATTTPQTTGTGTGTVSGLVPNDGTAGTSVVDNRTTGTNTTSNTFDAQKYAESIVKNPTTGMTPATTLSDNVKSTQINSNQAQGGLIKDSSLQQNNAPNQFDQTASTVNSTATAAPVAPKTATGYDAKTTADQVAAQDMTGAHGTVSTQAQVDPNAGVIDTKSIASGYNPDGTLNATGQALQDFAHLDLNDVDARATSKGQLEILQADFTGPNGEPQIPVYAQGAARAVSRIAAFSGMTGTAATAAMATAMMESSIQVANSDANFYQTLTLQNLSNKQASTIQRAGILGNMELQNADNRMAAAIQNSQAFLQMDLANLSNDQQARVINTQDRVQSILEDAKSVNTARMFTADAKNNMGMFYDNLNSNIQQFNADQTNHMSQFNAGEVNSMKQFNASLENNRQQFYKNMQFNVDTANAKWRQDVTLNNSNQKFNAAALDVKNSVDLSTEALNQLWDRGDAMLDYIWKSNDNDKERANALAIANLSAATQQKIAKMQADSADSAGWGSVFGTIAGNIAGSDKFTNWLFS